MDYFLNSHMKSYGIDLGQSTRAEYPLYALNTIEPAPNAHRKYTLYDTVSIASGNILPYASSIPFFRGYTYYSGSVSPSQHMYMEGFRFNKYYSRYNLRPEFSNTNSFELIDNRSGYIFTNNFLDFADASNIPGEPFYDFEVTGDGLTKRQSFKLNPSGDWIYDYENCYNEYSWDITKHILSSGELNPIQWDVYITYISGGVYQTLYPLDVQDIQISGDYVKIFYERTSLDFINQSFIGFSGVRFTYKDYTIYRDWNSADPSTGTYGHVDMMGASVQFDIVYDTIFDLILHPSGRMVFTMNKV